VAFERLVIFLPQSNQEVFMQYILTQEERNNLVPMADLDKAKVALNEARKELLKANDFTCWHDPQSNSDYNYCDNCPCSSIQEGKDYKTWGLVCSLSKNYSK
jgi:hypothetical protein